MRDLLLALIAPLIMAGVAVYGLRRRVDVFDGMVTGASDGLRTVARIFPALVALLSAVLSSADSCLVTASTVLCNDLLHRRSVALCRLVTLLFGICGLLLAGRGHGILDLLLMANDVYVCGVAVPVFTAMLMKRGAVPSGAAIAAMLVGGAGGMASAVSGEPHFGYVGMALAVALMLGGRFMTPLLPAVGRPV